MISKILFQKSKNKVDDYIVNMIKSNLLEEWKYINFVNGDEVKYFTDNPLDEFPDIIKVFNSIVKQQHKADLFRYYYLYINGGVYLDSDAMIHDNITNIIKEYDFVSVLSTVPSVIFNGFIASVPKHPIMYEALKDMYTMNKRLLDFDNNYFASGRLLYTLVTTSKYENIYLYNEVMVKGIGYTYDKDRMCLITHYPITKIIPNLDSNQLKPYKVGWTPATLKKFAYFKK